MIVNLGFCKHGCMSSATVDINTCFLPLYWHPWRNVMVDDKNRPNRASRSQLSKWIDTIRCQRKSRITRFFFKVWPFFLHVCKCKTICGHSKNIISTSIPYMVIHKLCYVFAPKQSLQAWNNGNIMKNLTRHFLVTWSVRYLLLWHIGHSVANSYWL